jgi:hypothetical protein
MTPREELTHCAQTLRDLEVLLESEKDDETAYANFGAAMEYTRRRARRAAAALCEGERPPSEDELAKLLERKRGKVASIFIDGARFAAAEGLANIEARALSYIEARALSYAEGKVPG